MYVKCSTLVISGGGGNRDTMKLSNSDGFQVVDTICLNLGSLMKIFILFLCFIIYIYYIFECINYVIFTNEKYKY